MIQLFDAFGESAETFCDYSMRCAYKRPLLPIFLPRAPLLVVAALNVLGQKFDVEGRITFTPKASAHLTPGLKTLCTAVAWSNVAS